MDDLLERQEMLGRFRRLMTELGRGSLTRNTFHEWEVAILLDFEGLAIDVRRRGELLRQYSRAVEDQLDSGLGPPMTFSEFLRLQTTRLPETE